MVRQGIIERHSRPRSLPGSGETVRTIYLVTLERVTAAAEYGDADRAAHALLTLNAGYFLGEWLAPRTHDTLVVRLAAAVRPFNGMALPHDELHATLLAQQAREVAAAFGAMPWTDEVVGRTAALIPVTAEDWDAMVLTAARVLAETSDGHALLLAHARRRLWEMSQPLGTVESKPSAVPAALVRIARRLARSGDGHAVQIAEAALAECSASAAVTRPLTEVLRALDGRLSGHRYQTASGRSMPRRSSAVSGRSGSTSHQRRNS